MRCCGFLLMLCLLSEALPVLGVGGEVGNPEELNPESAMYTDGAAGLGPGTDPAAEPGEVGIDPAVSVSGSEGTDPEPPAVSAAGAVLLSGETGRVIFGKNPHEKRSMASTTKILTALVALEEVERLGDPIVEITEEMTAVEGSSMGLRPKDRLSLTDVVGGMMMSSGNDAANTIALYLGETEEGFQEMMNRRAREIGMTDSYFVTASGLDAPAHVSTPYDMGLLGVEALRNQQFREICGASAYEVTFLKQDSVSAQDPERTVRYENHNKLLKLYEDCIGIKTGFTKKSGRCLVSAAERDGTLLVAVTLNAPDDWQDHMDLFAYGFSRLSSRIFDERAFTAGIPVVGSDRETILVGGIYGGKADLPKGTDLTRVVKLPKFLYGDVEKGERVGYIEYRQEGQTVYRLPILAQQEVRSIRTNWFQRMIKKIFHRE